MLPGHGQGVEDCVGDFFEAKASFGVATLDVANSNHVVGKVYKLILMSEGVLKDAMFARQLVRKFG